MAKSLRVTITGDATKLRRELGGAEGSLSRFAARARKVGDGMQRVGRRMTKFVTVPLAGLAVGVTRMGMKFDESFSRIQGLVGITGGALDGLRKGVLRLAGQTARSPQELGDALFYVTSAGFRGKEALGILEQAARAAAAGLGDTNDIAKLLTGALNAYPDLKADVALDQLAKAAEQGSFEVSELAAVLGNSLPVASALGIGFDSVTSSVASLTKLNNDAGASLTQVEAIMSAMLKPSNQAEKALAEVGLSMADLRQEAAEKGLPAALQTLHGALGDNEEAIGRVFGRKEAISGFFGLMREGGTDVAGILDEVRDSTGKMDEAFDAAAATGAHKMRQAMASLQSVGLQLWNVMSGPMSSALDSVTDKLKSLADWFGNLSPKAQKNILIFAGLAAALGPVLVVAGMLVNALAGLAGVFAVIGAPVALVAAGVVALGAAFIYAYQHIDWFRDRVDQAVRAIQVVLGPAVEWVGEKLRGLGEFFGITRQTVGEEVAAMSNEAVGKTVDMVSGMTDQVRMLANDGKQLSGELADEWITNVHRMRDDSITAIEEQRAETRATAQQLYEDLDSITAEQAGAVIKNANEQADEATKAAERQAELVTQQIKLARDQGREISEDQARRIVAAMERQRDGVVIALTDQREQAENILARLRAESGKITLEMAAESIRNSAKQRDETIAAANKEYEDRVAAILAMQRDSDEFTADMAATAIREARGMRDDTIDAANEQHTGVVDEVAGMRKGVTREVDAMTGEVISDFDRFQNRVIDFNIDMGLATATTIGHFRNMLTGVTEALGDLIIEVALAGGRVVGKLRNSMETAKAVVAGAIESVVGWFRALPGRIVEALGNLGSKIASKFKFKLPGVSFSGQGDGPGAGRGGSALATVRRAMQGISGLYVTNTYRSPAHNARVGGSPTSFHMDKANPAVDVGGSMAALDQLHAKLARVGGRELLWRTKGHWRHLHYAHEGGTVDPSWPTLPGLRPDERPVITQVGETITAKGREAGGRDVATKLDKVIELLSQPRAVVLEINGREFARATAPEMSEELRVREVSYS